MNKSDIKKLAKYTALGKRLNPNFASFVLNKLSRKDLVVYLRFLKAIIDRETVRIQSAKPLSPALRKSISEKFSGKNLIFEQNTALGPGIKAVINDSIIDLTFEGYLDQTITSLKESL